LSARTLVLVDFLYCKADVEFLSYNVLLVSFISLFLLSCTFLVKDLTVEDGEFYQFCYLSGNGQVRGVSIPFQFVMDDFEIVPDMTCSEHPLDSFVHTQVSKLVSTDLNS